MNASLAITPEVGQLLYALTLAARPTVIIDLGASLGSSTIYLASALRDLGAGSIITTELLSEKAQQASSNLAAAGLGDLVDIRVGDASSRSPILTSESTFCSSTWWRGRFGRADSSWPALLELAESMRAGITG